jgi:hypothetical protein
MSYFSDKQFLDYSTNLLDSRTFYRNFSGVKMLNPVGSGDALISFQRASSGSYFDLSGFVKFASLNEPRFDHSPSGNSRGLLLESSRTNLLLRSAEFDNASWSKVASSVTANAATGPDGLLNADKIVENTAVTTQHRINQTVTVTSGISHSFTVYIKASERSKAWIRIITGTTNAGAFFDLTLGTITSVTSGTAEIKSVGNGWYRCAISGVTDGTTATCYINLVSDAGSGDYTGDGSSGYFVWGAQLEEGSFPTSYIETTSASVTRAQDVAVISGANFATGFNNPYSGSMLCQFQIERTLSSTETPYIMQISDGSNNNFIEQLCISISGQNQVYSNVRQNSGAKSVEIAPNINIGSGSAKIITSWNASGVYASVNGSATVSDITVTLPTGLNIIALGGSISGASLNGHLASVSFFNKAYPSNFLRSLSKSFEI